MSNQALKNAAGGCQALFAVLLSITLALSLVPATAFGAIADDAEAQPDAAPTVTEQAEGTEDAITDEQLAELQGKIDEAQNLLEQQQGAAESSTGSSSDEDDTTLPGEMAPMPGNIVQGIEDADGIATITEGGIYKLADSAAGRIAILTTEPVTLIGNGCAVADDGSIESASNPVHIDATQAPGAHLTLQDLYIYANAKTSYTVTSADGDTATTLYATAAPVSFAGADNALTVQGTVVIHVDDANAATPAVSVPAGTTLEINGEGALYAASTGSGAAIGAAEGARAGVITLGAAEADAPATRIFAQASGTAAAVGDGAGITAQAASTASPSGAASSAIIFQNVTASIAATASAPAVGTTQVAAATATAASQAAENAPLITVMPRASVNINTTGTGAAICTAPGKLVSKGGSLRTHATGQGVTDETAPVPQSANGVALATCAVDTRLIEAADTDAPFVITEDDTTIFQGMRNANVHVQEAVDAQLMQPTTIYHLPQNWQAFATSEDSDAPDPNLYLRLTPETHILNVGNQMLIASWDEAEEAFTVSDVATVMTRAFSMARSVPHKAVASVTGAGTLLINNAEETVATDVVTISAVPAAGSYLAQIRMAEGVLTTGAKLDYQVVATPGAEGAGEAAFSATVELPAAAADVSIVADFVPITWDGTVDTSWYNEEDTSFDLYYPAQYEGAAAIVNGCFTTYPTKANHSPDYNAYLDAMGSTQREDGSAQNNLYGEFSSTYTQPDAQLMLDRATQNMDSFNYVEGFGFSAAKTRTQRVVGNADNLFLNIDATGSSTASTSDQRFYGKEDFAGKQLNLMRDMDFGAMVDTSKEPGEAYKWNTDSPLFMPLGGYYDMIPLVNATNGYAVIGASFNGTLDGYGHTMSRIYSEHFTAGSTYGDSIGVGFVGGLGGFVGQKLPSYAQSSKYTVGVRRIVLDETCYFSGRRSTGGIVGVAGRRSGEDNGAYAVVEYCINKAFVKGTDKFGAGGVVGGAFMNGLIDNCANFGTVWQYMANPAGGIVGYNRMQISNCFNAGWITTGGDSYSMGIGTSNSGPRTVTNCYYAKNTGYQKFGSNGGGYYNGTSDTNNGSTNRWTVTAALLNNGGPATWVDDVTYDATDESTKGVNWMKQFDRVGAPARNFPKLWFQGGLQGGDEEEFTVTLEQGEGGSIGASALKGTFGTRVFLTNAAQPGYLFTGYEVTRDSADPQVVTADSVSISGNMTIKGIFVKADVVGVSWNTGAGWKMDVTQSGYLQKGDGYEQVSGAAVPNDADATDVLQGNTLRFSFTVTGAPEDVEKEYNGSFTLAINAIDAAGKKTATTASGNQATPAEYVIPGTAAKVEITITPKEEKKSWSTHADTAWYDADSAATAFTINTPEELAGFGVLVSQGVTFENKTVSLGRDIDLYYKDAQGVQRYWEGIGPDAQNAFAGTFDGQGHSIKGMRAFSNSVDNINRPIVVESGLFFNVNSAVIKNVVVDVENTQVGASIAYNAAITTIENCINNAPATLAGIVYSIGGTTAGDACLIKDCINYGNVRGAGIVAKAYTSTIQGCMNHGAVAGPAGILSYVQQNMTVVTIKDCGNFGDVTNDDGSFESAYGCAAGIVGYTHDGGVEEAYMYKGAVDIAGCVNAGTITSNGGSSFGGNAGGIAGSVRALAITDCYNKGTIRANTTSTSEYSNAGGIAGSVKAAAWASDAVEISNCYNAGNVSQGDEAGAAFYGFASTNMKSVVTNNYALEGVECTVWGSVKNVVDADLKKLTGTFLYYVHPDHANYQPGYEIIDESDRSTWPKAMQLRGEFYKWMNPGTQKACAVFKCTWPDVETKMLEVYGATTAEECYRQAFIDRYGEDALPVLSAEELRAAAPLLGSAWKTSMPDVNDGFPMLSWQLPYDLSFVDGSGSVVQSVGLEAGYSNADTAVIEGMFTGDLSTISGDGAKKGYVGSTCSGWAASKNGQDPLVIRNVQANVTAWPVFEDWIRDLTYATIAGTVSTSGDDAVTANVQVVHDGTVLVEGMDYTLTCTPSLSKKSATVSVTGNKAQKCQGSTKATFAVDAAATASADAYGLGLEGGLLGTSLEFGSQKLMVVPVVERYFADEEAFRTLQANEVTFPEVGLSVEDFAAYDVNLVMVDLTDPTYQRKVTEFADELAITFQVGSDADKDYSQHTAYVTQLHEDANGSITRPLEGAKYPVAADGTVTVRVKELSQFAITLAHGTPVVVDPPADEPGSDADPEAPGASEKPGSDNDQAYKDLLSKFDKLLGLLAGTASGGSGAAVGGSTVLATQGTSNGTPATPSVSGGSNAGSAGAGSAIIDGEEEGTEGTVSTEGTVISADDTPLAKSGTDVTATSGDADGAGVVSTAYIPWWVWLVCAAAVVAVGGAIILLVTRRRKEREALETL